MTTILRYRVPLPDPRETRPALTTMQMPAGAVLLDARLALHAPSYGRVEAHLWAIVDPDAEPEQRRLSVWQEGREGNLADNDHYVASVATPDGSRVWHHCPFPLNVADSQ